MGTQSIQTAEQSRSAVEFEMERHFRIMQNARAAAIEARREAIEEFWGGIGNILRGAFRSLHTLWQHAPHLRRRSA
ncbi:MAG: hypothetical protein ACRCV9_04940 [Burkholderiaceae bacterium]